MNEKKVSQKANKTKLYIIVGILMVASLAFRLLNDVHLEQSSILFIGLPSLITILLIKYSKTPKSIYGLVFKVITLFLLMSCILFGEGIVCILFMSPIFYGVSALIIFIYNYLKKRNKTYSIAIIPIIILLAQPFGIKSKHNLQTVETSKVFSRNISIHELNKQPDFMLNYPSFFKLGFPKPLNIKGKGIDKGTVRDIQFESYTKGIGTLSLEVSKKTDDEIIFKVISDNTHINHWLTWKEIKVEFQKINESQTKVIWTSSYTCDLGPQWYFEPLEEYAVEIMNAHLINSYFKE